LKTPTLFSNNQAAIALMHGHQYRPRTKDISLHYYWIHCVIKKVLIRLVYRPTDNMVTERIPRIIRTSPVVVTDKDLHRSPNLAEQ
jgi:hypothetical protein